MQQSTVLSMKKMLSDIIVSQHFKKLLFTLCIVSLISLAGCSGGSDEPTATPPPSTPPETPPPTPPPSPDPAPQPDTVEDELRKDAARLLTQASFGAKVNEVEATAEYLLTNMVSDWVDAQAEIEPTLHYPVARELRSGQEDLPGALGRPHRMDAWWRATLLGDDQLRQRLAFALSQLFVISENSQLENFQVELANWYDLLLLNAFGNYRDLMLETTKSPVMGLYLSVMGNEKPQPELNIRPDENFARELMQLFTIGLYELNIDGSIKLDEQGLAIPSYDQTLIEAYAHVFTGWHFTGKTEFTWDLFFVGLDFVAPMEVLDVFHDEGEKILLDGYVVAAGTEAEIALEIAIESLFQHPNVGPFVATHLIQHLVSSNPSPAYVARVATVFNDNGNGVRGDMLAVVKAVLSDEEARDESYYTQTTYGRVKQPLIRATQSLRALLPESVDLPSNSLAFRELVRIQEFTAQAPLGAPSVFNFFLPDHRVNGELTELNMVTPEFQMVTSNNVIKNSNLAGFILQSNEAQALRERIGFSFAPYESLLLDNRQDLINLLNFTFIQGQMSDGFAQVLIDYDNQLASTSTPETRVKEMLNLLFTSPQFAVQY